MYIPVYPHYLALLGSKIYTIVKLWRLPVCGFDHFIKRSFWWLSLEPARNCRIPKKFSTAKVNGKVVPVNMAWNFCWREFTTGTDPKCHFLGLGWLRWFSGLEKQLAIIMSIYTYDIPYELCIYVCTHVYMHHVYICIIYYRCIYIYIQYIYMCSVYCYLYLHT